MIDSHNQEGKIQKGMRGCLKEGKQKIGMAKKNNTEIKEE